MLCPCPPGAEPSPSGSSGGCLCRDLSGQQQPGLVLFLTNLVGLQARPLSRESRVGGTLHSAGHWWSVVWRTQSGSFMVKGVPVTEAYGDLNSLDRRPGRTLISHLCWGCRWPSPSRLLCPGPHTSRVSPGLELTATPCCAGWLWVAETSM